MFSPGQQKECGLATSSSSVDLDQSKQSVSICSILQGLEHLWTDRSLHWEIAQ